jgi:acyl transferase domain-containing protein
MVQDYQSLLSNSSTSFNLSDAAYTLTNRREHLVYKSFAVVSHEKFDMVGAVSPQQSGQVKSSVTMVFTGQGAALPRCGRELTCSNHTFSQITQSLDKHLQTLGADAPSWTLQEELSEPAEDQLSA